MEVEVRRAEGDVVEGSSSGGGVVMVVGGA